MKYLFFSAALLLALAALPATTAQAQPTSGGPAPSAPAAIDTPLDGGASLLLASGLAFGLRKLRQRRQK